MKAIITAAGIGTRLEKITQINNKCLLRVGNKSLIEHSIAAIKKQGIEDIYVITGHHADNVESKLNKKATFIFNPFYKNSGILVSSWFAKKYLYGKEFLFLMGDVLYDPDILTKMIHKKGEVVICVERKKFYDKEDSKVIIKNNKIVFMGKNLPLKKVSGEFCCIAKFSKEGGKRFFDKIDEFLRGGRLNTYLMDALNELIYEGVNLVPLDISNNPRIEIDFLKDLEDAKTRIYPLIENKLK